MKQSDNKKPTEINKVGAAPISIPDNHVDETMTTFAERIAVEAQQLKIGAIDYPLYIARRNGTVKAIRAELDQYYADFYRNKIPGKEVTSWSALNNDERWHDYNTGYNQAIDDTTAQFNSEGDSDEQVY